MGTPDFAVASLDALLQNDFYIAGVITTPDKPAGRGKKITQSEVKKYALKKGLRILQPTNLQAPEFIEELKSLNANLQIVVAFRMLPEKVWSMPEYGTFNLHASLLPQYRGAAPINHVIINGEKETGVTTFFLQHEIDTGNIIFRKKIPILPDETAGELHDKLKQTGAVLVVKTTQAILNNDYSLTRQDELIGKDEILKEAPKIFREDCRINWNNDVHNIYNFIRGLAPYPAAFTELISSENEKVQIKIFKASKELVLSSDPFGTLKTNNKDKMSIKAKDGFINIHRLQLSGKRRVSIKEFLNGFKFTGDWKISY